MFTLNVNDCSISPSRVRRGPRHHHRFQFQRWCDIALRPLAFGGPANEKLGMCKNSCTWFSLLSRPTIAG